MSGLAEAAIGALVPVVLTEVADALREKRSADELAVRILDAALKQGVSPTVLAQHLSTHGRLEGELAGDIAQIAITGSLGR